MPTSLLSAFDGLELSPQGKAILLLVLLPFLPILTIVYIIFDQIGARLEVTDRKSKPVLITGCDSGFGRAYALRLAAEGTPVFAGCLLEASVTELEFQAKNLPGELIAFQLDVSSDESVALALALVESAVAKYGGLYGLVNNAGIAGYNFANDFLNVNDYKKVLEVNTFGVIRTTIAFMPLIKKSKGRVVNVASVCGRFAAPFLGPYTTSKHAVEGFTDTLRVEYSAFGVHVAVVEPGYFRTGITDTKTIRAATDFIWNRASPELRAEYGEHYFKASQAKSIKSLQVYNTNSLDPVLNAFSDALFSARPRRRYYAGIDAWLMYIPLSLLPAGVTDTLLNVARWVVGYPKPGQTQQKTVEQGQEQKKTD